MQERDAAFMGQKVEAKAEADPDGDALADMLWSAFEDLRATAGRDEGGPMPISYEAIDAYARRSTLRMRFWQVELIREADAHWLNAAYKDLDRKRKAADAKAKRKK